MLRIYHGLSLSLTLVQKLLFLGNRLIATCGLISGPFSGLLHLFGAGDRICGGRLVLIAGYIKHLIDYKAISAYST